MRDLALGHGLGFSDLYCEEGLARVDALFLERLGPDLADRLVAARKDPPDNPSALLLELTGHLQSFVADLFGIEAEMAALAGDHLKLKTLFDCKRVFVQRFAAKAYTAEEARDFDGAELNYRLEERISSAFDEMDFAATIMGWMADQESHADDLHLAAQYAAWALYTEAGLEKHRHDTLFHLHGRTDYDRLVDVRDIRLDCGALAKESPTRRFVHREGFSLTDPGADIEHAVDQAAYCVLCHNRGRDQCRIGAHDKQTGDVTTNPLGVRLEGCPLEVRISEMHAALLEGHPLGALALVMIDNPMLAGTGHRICNDCMKACIYQKQDPVDIPEAETRSLKSILSLPWGFEIYSLLSRWNPLDIARPLPLPDSGRKVLVVGMGPAGYTLAHHLLRSGHWVVGIDGLKIEPLPTALAGPGFQPIRDISEIWEDLDARTQAGFGGVAEYGITVRWDKNFLKIIRLLLERRSRFTLLGGVRFGGNIDAETAWEMGFDHIALCLGAGRPTLPAIPGILAKGVRTASDFLMALQLTGAAKPDSLANLQLRLPVVVIGGGLTAIDAATEALAYYVRQVDKFSSRYRMLAGEKGEEAVRAAYSPQEMEIVDEFLAHAAALAGEREKAAARGGKPDFVPLLQKWGGATVAYRRAMTASPAYRLNHDEIAKALAQGVRFAEMLAPVAVATDAGGHVQAIHMEIQETDMDGRPKGTGKTVEMPSRCLLIAAGTTPNTVLSRENPGFATMDGRYFLALDEDGRPVKPEATAKPSTTHVLMNRRPDGRCMSFLGDLHPSFAGNVVKAMASARRGFPVIDRALSRLPPDDISGDTVLKRMKDGLKAFIHDVQRLTPNTVQVTLKAPLAARSFRPGQFFRIQNFEADAARVMGTPIAMEGVALTGAIVEPDAGLVSLIAMEMGGSTSLLKTLRPGQPMALMGPTGVATEVKKGETALLCGGGLGNAVLMTISKAFREAGSRVLYFAAYKDIHDRFHIDRIEANADVVIWCCDREPGFVPSRPGDKSFVGNIVEAMLAYAEGRLGPTPMPISECDRMIVIGSDRMMEAVQKARSGLLRPHIRPDVHDVASINSPMQCMMKEICGQCLQRQQDPESGSEKVVFSCFCQDQPLRHVDFEVLRDRLGQNAVQEKLTRQWIARITAVP